MRELVSSLLVAGIVLGGLASQSAAAQEGGRVLDPRKCPGLIEDRIDRRESLIDERFDRGPRDVREDIRDRRESRRDRAAAVCPRRAFEWRPQDDAAMAGAFDGARQAFA